MELAEQPICSLVFQECPTAFMNLTHIPLFQICPIPQRSTLFSSIKPSFSFRWLSSQYLSYEKQEVTQTLALTTGHKTLSIMSCPSGREMIPDRPLCPKQGKSWIQTLLASGKALLPGKQVLSWNVSSAKNPKSFDVFLLVFWVFFFFSSLNVYSLKAGRPVSIFFQGLWDSVQYLLHGITIESKLKSIYNGLSDNKCYCSAHNNVLIKQLLVFIWPEESENMLLPQIYLMKRKPNYWAVTSHWPS